MSFDTKEFEGKMAKTIDSLRLNLGTVRAGKANPEVLSRVNVDYYGTPTPVAQMAAIQVPDPRTLVIAPWDTTTLKDIEKAILASDVGITPQSDGKVIRLAFPQPTEERRKELAKQVSKLCEEAKVAIRNLRRDANDKVKDLKKNGDLTEDDVKISDKKIQDLTDKFIKDIDAIGAEKSKEIMSI